MRLQSRRWMFVVAAAVLCAELSAHAGPALSEVEGPARLKDIASLEGVRPSPLIGYGLVVGLNKTGDKRQTIFTAQTLTNALERFGVRVSADEIKVENTAAVLVTTELPAYARVGTRLDVTVSSIGDARSLQGGMLIATPLKGATGDIVGIAQGALSIGGFGGGSGGTSVQVNHLTVGRVPAGGVVESATPMSLPTSSLTLSLHDPDFITASRVTQAVNATLGSAVAKTVDAGTIVLSIPDAFKDAVPELMAKLDAITVDTDTVATVVINERTGTVVVGGDVRIGATAVAHGNLSVRIATRYDVSQPMPYSAGQTAVVPNQRVDVQEGTARLVTLEEGTTLDAVVRALNALGASPRDIIAIMQALKAAGALRAEIKDPLMTDFTAIDRLVKSALAAPDTGATLASAPSAADQAKIRDLAAQFESLLIAQLMKDLQASLADPDDDKGQDGFDTSPLSDAMNSELGLALSHAGGFGLGESLAGAMLRQVAPDAATKVDPSMPLKNPPTSPITPVSPTILLGENRP